jgi:hypothetical protein
VARATNIVAKLKLEVVVKKERSTSKVGMLYIFHEKAVNVVHLMSRRTSDA